MATPNNRKVAAIDPNRQATHKGELVVRWEKKAADLEQMADRRDDRGDDGTDLRIISDIYRVCALELTQAEF